LSKRGPGQEEQRRFLARLCRVFPGMKVIGLTVEAPTAAEVLVARRCGMATLLSRSGRVTKILNAIRNERGPLKSAPPDEVGASPPATEGGRGALTERGMAVPRRRIAATTGPEHAPRRDPCLDRPRRSREADGSYPGHFAQDGGENQEPSFPKIRCS